MNQIKIGALISYLGLFINILIGLIYTPWMINTIGSSDYGLYTLAMSIIGLLAFDFGLGNATAKFISQYLAEKRQDKVDNLLSLIYKLYLVLDIVLLIVLGGIFLFIADIYTGLTEIELGRFSKIFLIASSFCVITFPFIPLNGVLTSYEKFIPLKLCDLFHKVFIVITMTGCLLLGYGLYALVVVNSIAGVFTALAKLYVVKSNTPIKINYHFWDKSQFKEIVFFIIWVSITALAQRCIFNIAPSVLGILSDSSAIAILGIVITLESYVYLFANAINGMFLPRVSRFLSSKDNQAILELMIRVGRLQIYIIGFIIICIISLGKHFVSVWIGESYELIYPCLLLVVFPSFLHLPQEIGLTCLIAANKVKKQAQIFVCMAIVNIVLSIPLTMYMGIIGMCISIFIAYIVRTIGLDIIFYKELNINVFTFFKYSYGKMFFPLVIVCCLTLSVNSVLPNNGWGILLLKGLVVTFIYILLMYIMSVNEYEKKLFFSPIKKLLS